MNKSFLLSIFLIAAFTYGGIKKVPSEFANIQAAINASVTGDTVLVSPGTYYENINFNGKKITVGSLYVTTLDESYILSTIINGSTPVHPDTASCVLFINHEDSTSVLSGFTLTGGTGTKWTDEHGAGLYFEGGGVLTALSSPTIKRNIFYNNEAIRKTDTRSAGGGGIRSGDGGARILNNIFIQNRGMYGGAIVLNYCAGAVVQNNIIIQNYVFQAVTGAPTFGGGGIWINDQLPGNSTSNIVSNNTIVGNYAYGTGPATLWAGHGGGVFSSSSNVIFTNNIVWNNTQAAGNQVNMTGGSVVSTYNNTQEPVAGTGNISLNPLFTDSRFILMIGSPLIDAGNPDVSYNDIPDPLNPNLALFPSRGTVRNDIGAYGGKLTWNFPFMFKPGILFTQQSYDFGNVSSGGSKTIYLKYYNSGGIRSKIDSVSFMANTSSELSVEGAVPGYVNSGYADSIAIKWSPLQNKTLSDTVLVYHDSVTVPLKISIKGISQTTGVNDQDGVYSFNLYQNYPNPFNPSTKIKYSVPQTAKVTLKVYNILGSVTRILINEEKEKGEYEYIFNSEGLPSGIYFYELTSGDKKEVKKFVLLR